MNSEIEEWEIKKGAQFLKNVGIEPKQTVLDFGCRAGRYSILTAKIVGDDGTVYALDKNSSSLDKLAERCQRIGLNNIKIIKTSGKLKIPLKNESIDAVLLYDVIHLVGKNDSSVISDRKKLYEEINRVARKNSLVSVYPTHLATHTEVTLNKEIKKEIEKAGFKFEKEWRAELIHDDNKIEGQILNFRKI